ncbi:hypothetical protein C8R46DRAFT_1159888 [Mycena filopes]|nr:hypothetical protein C8R46DRAFT_1159888 [Mycena filopes]
MSNRDVSAILGEYMLKVHVQNAGCNVPSMRSPTGKTPVVHFCASCDGSPDCTRSFFARLWTVSSDPHSHSSHLSRTSTPPTEISSTLSSPVFALPAETEESRRRREQSDQASAAIGQRVLTSRCFGVPLVRPPKAGGEKDPRKECVVCGIVYVTEVDWAGRERLVPENVPKELDTPSKGKSRVEEKDPASRSPQLETIVASPQVQSNGLHLTLNESAKGLESTLRTLSGRLTSLTAGHSDPSSIGSAADAISKVVLALGHIRQLQWAEKHAGENL